MERPAFRSRAGAGLPTMGWHHRSDPAGQRFRRAHPRWGRIGPQLFYAVVIYGQKRLYKYTYMRRSNKSRGGGSHVDAGGDWGLTAGNTSCACVVVPVGKGPAVKQLKRDETHRPILRLRRDPSRLHDLQLRQLRGLCRVVDIHNLGAAVGRSGLCASSRVECRQQAVVSRVQDGTLAADRRKLAPQILNRVEGVTFSSDRLANHSKEYGPKFGDDPRDPVV